MAPWAGREVSLVIPALNEGAIGWVLERIPVWVSEVILVDGRSADATELGGSGLVPNLVVVHQPQLGKGAALRAGFAAARGDIIVALDADGSTNPAELGRFVRALQHGAGDFVKGSRHLTGGGSEDADAAAQSRQPGVRADSQQDVRLRVHGPVLRLLRVLAAQSAVAGPDG